MCFTPRPHGHQPCHVILTETDNIVHHLLCLCNQAEDRLAAESHPVASKVVPSSNYRDKYKHLIGDTAAKDAAQSTVTNRSYGFGGE